MAPSDRAREVRKDGVRRAFERDLSHLTRLRPCQRFRRQNGGAIDRDAARPFTAQIGSHAFKACCTGLAGAVGDIRRHVPIVGFYIHFRARHMRCGADIDRACHRVTRDAQRAADGSGRRVRPPHRDEVFELVCHAPAEIRHLRLIFVDTLDFLGNALQGFDDAFRVDADVRLAVHHAVRLLRRCVDLRRAAQRRDRRVIADMDVRRLREEVDVRRAG